MSSGSNGGEWGPFGRRHTVPMKPGVNKFARGVHSIVDKSEISDEPDGLLSMKRSEASVAQPFSGNAAKLGEVGLEGTASADAANVKDHRISTKSSETSYSLKIHNSTPLSLFELKPSCKIDVNMFSEMSIGVGCPKYKLSTGGQKKPSMSVSSEGPGTSKSDFNPQNSVYGKKELEISKQLAENKKWQFSHCEKAVLKVVDINSDFHALQGHRQQVNHSSGKYFVLGQSSDGAFTAHPVNNWYTFEPKLKYKPLSVEEADEQFEKRDKIMNFFSVMVKKRLKGEAVSDEEDPESKSKLKRSKIQTEDSEPWIDTSSSESDNETEERVTKRSRKQSRSKLEKRKKIVKAKNDEEEEDVADDSCSGNNADDSSSDSDVAENSYEQRGVDEEDGMKSLLKWESSDNSSDDEKDVGTGDADQPNPQTNKEKSATETGVNTKNKKKSRKPAADVSKKGASEKQSRENSDKNDATKKTGTDLSRKSKSHETMNAMSPDKKVLGKSSLVLRKGEEGTWDVKRVAVSDDDASSTGSPPSKRSKMSNEISKALRLRAKEAGVTIEAVRRYLLRKPLSTQDLCQKFLSKRLSFSKDELTVIIADHLFAINPSKFMTNGKTLMYIPTEADKNSVYFSMIENSQSQSQSN